MLYEHVLAHNNAVLLLQANAAMIYARQSLYLFIISFVFFACIQAFILFAAGYLTFLHANEFLPYANWESFSTVVTVFKAAGYHVLILALFCCYGVYIISAILYGEPW